jgi:hypothetical protein
VIAEVSMVNIYRLLSWSFLIACSLINTISADDDDGSDDGTTIRAYVTLHDNVAHIFFHLNVLLTQDFLLSRAVPW